MLEYFKTKNSLLKRIEDLEKLSESLIGSNSILDRELQETKLEKKEILDKLFQLTGVNKTQVTPKSSSTTQPIQISNRAVPWSKVREKLEAEAKTAYWERKKAEGNKEIKEDKEVVAKLGKLGTNE